MEGHYRGEWTEDFKGVKGEREGIFWGSERDKRGILGGVGEKEKVFAGWQNKMGRVALS